MPHSAACPAGVPEHRLPVIPETCPPGEGMSDSGVNADGACKLPRVALFCCEESR